MLAEALQEVDVRAWAHDVCLLERAAHPAQRIGAVATVHDELGDHGVVEDAEAARQPLSASKGRAETRDSPDVVPGPHTRVHTHKTAALCGCSAGRSEIGREREMLEMTDVGQEVGCRVFGVKARLKRVPDAWHLGLRQRQSSAGGHKQLPLDEVD